MTSLALHRHPKMWLCHIEDTGPGSQRSRQPRNRIRDRLETWTNIGPCSCDQHSHGSMTATSGEPAPGPASLLQVEIDAIFGLNTLHGRPLLHSQNDGKVDIVFARSKDSVVLAATTKVSLGAPGLSRVFSQLERDCSSSLDPDGIIETLNRILEIPIDSTSGGPSYRFPSGFFDAVLDLRSIPEDIRLITSDDQDLESLIPCIEECEVWETEEWRKLLAGLLGPWSIAVLRVDGDGKASPDDAARRRYRPIATCFASRRKPRAVETGVWTHDDLRGKGLATAIVARWALLEHRSGIETIFYSTSSDNLASQGVARKLRLDPFAMIWKIKLPVGWTIEGK